MIPGNVKLFTWLDVEEIIYRQKESGEWPNGLIWVRAYYDSLTLGIQENNKNQIEEWLSKTFYPRFDTKTQEIKLESIQENKNLPIILEYTNEKPQQQQFIPTFSRPKVFWPSTKHENPSAFQKDYPPIITFHSFKGGVGRTLHAIALSIALNKKGKKILLIDADLEAPGLSWIFPSRIPNSPMSLVDILALIHSSFNENEKNENIKLIVNRLQDSNINGIFALPAFRSIEGFNNLEIRPEHLTQNADDPFILSNILSEIGKGLGVDIIIIDLRAGLSELSSGLLLDPRIYRIFVTTLSSQSICGTQTILKILEHDSPSVNENEPIPALLVTYVPDDYLKNDEISRKLINERISPIIESIKKISRSNLSENDIDTQSIIYQLSPFNQNLLVLPKSWDEITKKINDANLIEKMQVFIDWTGTDLKTIYGDNELYNAEELKKRRKKLAEFSHLLVQAEKAEVRDFLTIRPLLNLAANFRSKPPVVMIIGAKGSGKTYIYLQVIRRKHWNNFANDIGIKDTIYQGQICPIFYPKNLSESARKMVIQTQIECAEYLNFKTHGNYQEITDHIRDCLKIDHHEGEWRDIWLNIIAWSAGFDFENKNAGRLLFDYLRENKKSIICVFDGLEDLFQELSNNARQQTAIRALTQELPELLEQQPLRPVGLLVFIRQDMINHAIKQNPAHLISKYEPYVLKWSYEEALKLVCWIVKKSEVYDIKIKETDIHELKRSDVIEHLYPLWGRKLGSDSSREARSADWVITALSDLNGQIQARDLVRFVMHAASSSVEVTKYWSDRFLVPNAVREAIRNCSIEKIKEIELENYVLKNLFSKIRSVEPDSRIVPFSSQLLGLNTEELQILESNGVILHLESDFYMPEIYRLGLNFKMKAGARPRVFMLAKRAQKWDE